jgi:hypothetical protein
MKGLNKPYVHVGIDAVDAVVCDVEGYYDPEVHDRYESFDTARDAALTSIEAMLDERDYDGEDHREELERMRVMLEAARSYGELEALSGYQWFLRKLPRSRTFAA